MTQLPMGLATTAGRASLLGLVAGGRSFTPVALLASGTRARTITAVLALGELVGDKLPRTPSRLSPPSLAFRLVIGAASGAATGLRARNSGFRAPDPAGRPGEIVLPALSGVAAALAGSYLGSGWRSVAAGWFGSDLPGALLEDATVLSLGWIAGRG